MTWFVVGWLLGAGGHTGRQIGLWDVLLVLTPLTLFILLLLNGERISDWMESRWPELKEERERQERAERSNAGRSK